MVKGARIEAVDQERPAPRRGHCGPAGARFGKHGFPDQFAVLFAHSAPPGRCRWRPDVLTGLVCPLRRDVLVVNDGELGFAARPQCWEAKPEDSLRPTLARRQRYSQSNM